MIIVSIIKKWINRKDQPIHEEEIPVINKQVTSFPWISPLTFLVALLGFFLVFTDVNCNGTKLDSITGIELVRGYKQDLDISKENERECGAGTYDPNIFALNAFWQVDRNCVVYHQKRAIIIHSLPLSLIGFDGMLMLMLDLKTKDRGRYAEPGNSTLNIDLNIEFEIEVGILAGYFLLLVAAYWNFMKLRTKPIIQIIWAFSGRIVFLPAKTVRHKGSRRVFLMGRHERRKGNAKHLFYFTTNTDSLGIYFFATKKVILIAIKQK